MGDIDLEAYFNDYWESNSYQGQQVLGVPEAPPLENTLTRDPDLYDHLLWQLHMCGAPDNLRQLAELIIGNLDTDGFWSLAEEIQRCRVDDATPSRARTWSAPCTGAELRPAGRRLSRPAREPARPARPSGRAARHLPWRMIEHTGTSSQASVPAAPASSASSARLEPAASG